MSRSAIRMYAIHRYRNRISLTTYGLMIILYLEVFAALRIHCSEQSKQLLDQLGGYQVEERGPVYMKVRRSCTRLFSISSIGDHSNMFGLSKIIRVITFFCNLNECKSIWINRSFCQTASKTSLRFWSKLRFILCLFDSDQHRTL